jgi:hypothetical protein
MKCISVISQCINISEELYRKCQRVRTTEENWVSLVDVTEFRSGVDGVFAEVTGCWRADDVLLLVMLFRVVLSGRESSR